MILRPVHLQLSKRVVTLLLARSLLSTQGDQLVDAVSHRPETMEKTTTEVIRNPGK